MRRAPFALALALGAALAAAQEPPQGPAGTTADRQRALAARVARLRGKALVQAPGAGGWLPLAEDALLSAGDRVRADDGPVELVVPGSEAAVRDLGTSGGDRVVLAPDARVLVGPPGTDARLRLEEGGVFATGSDGLRVQAGDTTVTVRGGDAELDVSRSGDVTVTVHSGRVDVGTSPRNTETRALTESERLTLDARGARVSKTKPRPPAYVTQLLEAIGKLVRAPVTFQPWPGEFTEFHGARDPAGFVTSTSKFTDPQWPDDKRVEVRIGRTSEEGGLWVHEPGTRVRVKYRLSVPALFQLDLQYQTATEGRRFRSTPFLARAGAWDEAEFRCEELKYANTDEPLHVEPGYRATYLCVYTGDAEGSPPGLRLDVARILVFTTKPR